MVGKESEEYRPRRALSYDPAPAPDDDLTAAGGDDPTPAGGDDLTAAGGDDPTPAGGDDPTLAGAHHRTAAAGQAATADADDEERKPLYRDEVDQAHLPPQMISAPSLSTSDVGTGEDRTEVRTRVVAGAVRRLPGTDESTQILPRTQRSSYAVSRSDFDRAGDDLDDADTERNPMGQRTRMALLVVAVAAVVIVGLVIGYATLALGDNPTTSPRPAASVPGAGSASSAGPASPSDPHTSVVLTDDSMLSAAGAKRIAADRSWKVALTQRGLEDDSPQPACLGPDALEGQPASQQTVLRTLTSSGTTAPRVLHQADAYPTPEEASQAYVLAAKALGGCAMTGAYIDSGQAVSGVGDQAVGVTVDVAADSKTEIHSVMLNRTGQVINVIDAVSQGTAVSTDGLAKALAQVTNAQCKTADGRCAGEPTVTSGPPPVGGDQPGFLATGDLPPVGKPVGTWAGTVPKLPQDDFTGSGCERVNWLKVEAQTRSARTYLLQDNPVLFGLDEIVLTVKGEKAAADLAVSVKDDLQTCPKRKLTATVSGPRKVSGTGASGTDIAGWTAGVSQKTSDGAVNYRVGIVSVGSKVIFTFLNPQRGLDLTDSEFDAVTIRAGQRATQVKE